MKYIANLQKKLLLDYILTFLLKSPGIFINLVMHHLTRSGHNKLLKSKS